MSIVLVSTTTSRPFAQRIASALNVPLRDIERLHFPDGEYYLRFDLQHRLDLLDQDVILIGSTDSGISLEEVYRLGCSAVKSGARMLVLVIPYYGYSTMERAVRPGEVVTAKVIARQLSNIPRARRGTWILLMDLHQSGIVHYFENDVVALELYAQDAIIPAIQRLQLSPLCLASTDMGRAKWVEALANKLDAPVALIHKKRLSGSETKVSFVLGEVEGRHVVIYDDMIRTGSSLIKAAEAYLKAGALSVHALATHLVLPPGSIERLEAAPLVRILGTDTHPNHTLVQDRPRFGVISVATLFVEVLRTLVH